MNIKWVGAHSNNYGSRYNNKIQFVILHWIVGTLESADATFQSPTRLASAHYGVGDSDIHQYVKEEDCAWHAGNLLVNHQSIGIENEGGPNLPITEATYKTLAELVKDICSRYQIPVDRQHIKGHKEVSDKPTACPGTLDIDKVIKLINEDNMTDEQKLVIAKIETFYKSNPELQGGNLEGAVNALLGWANDLPSKVKEIESLKMNITDLQNQINDINRRLNEITLKLAEEQKLNLNQQKELATANKKLSETNQNLVEMTTDRDGWRNRYNNKNDEYNNLNNTIEDLVKQRVAEKLEKLSFVDYLKSKITLLFKI